jgi:hypothetical protein
VHQIATSATDLQRTAEQLTTLVGRLSLDAA